MPQSGCCNIMWITIGGLPWRAPPGSPPPDPYRVWLSEVMLQQTTVAAVTPAFRALRRALADGRGAGRGAGRGRPARMGRARLLCPRPQPDRLRPGGRASAADFRTTKPGLRQLPGIGAYTAAAIAAIAFGRARRVVDTNVERVVARLHAIERTPGRAPKSARLADAMTPAERSGDFAQAMMDLGATICRRAAPAARLPAAPTARPSRSGEPEAFPAQERAQGPAARVTALPGGSSATAASGWCAARPRACSAAWRRCRGRSGRPTTAATGAAMATLRHVFTHFALDSRRAARRAARRRLVAPDRRARRGRPADPLPPRGRSGAQRAARSCRLSRSSPGPGSTAPICSRASPARWPSWPGATMRAASLDGRPASRSTRMAGSSGQTRAIRRCSSASTATRRASPLCLPASATSGVAFACSPSSTQGDATLCLRAEPRQLACAPRLCALRPAERRVRGGWSRRCPGCGAEHFPRFDPVVIMLAEHDGRVLLGRQPHYPPGRYSALAGFVEPGETIEAAVARELQEEAGIERRRRALRRQPALAFPSSLMIGCTRARADRRADRRSDRARRRPLVHPRRGRGRAGRGGGRRLPAAAALRHRPHLARRIGCRLK